jgi:hypothetical protein
MRNRLAWVAGALGAAGVAYRALRRAPVEAAPATDPRADELRRKLDESKAAGDDRDEFESGETRVDEAEASVDAKRAAVHERARDAAREMRGPNAGA